GNTLVVESTNMSDKLPIDQENIADAGRPTEALRMVERFSRIAPDQLQYELTVDDPNTWTRPWTVRIPFKQDPGYELYEYACHEANYGLVTILVGAREVEKEREKAAKLNKVSN